MALLDDIRDQFPYLAFLINDPEIGALLADAVDPNKGFSASHFEAAVMGTQWWQSRSAAQRDWDILTNNDPGEADEQRSSYQTQLWFKAAQMGVRLTPGEVAWYTEYALRNGLSINDPRMIEGLAKLYTQADHRMEGSIRTGQGRALQVARGEFMVPISVNEAVQWGEWLGMGVKTEADLEQAMRERAQSYYPHLAADLKEGATMQSLFSGHIATIAEELELDPEAVDLTKGQFSKVIDVYDPNNQVHRPATLSEARTLARQDSRFWDTSNGRAMDAGMTASLLRSFGEIR